MADLVVGMAKTVVDGVLTKAQAAIEEEAKLRQSAQRNLVFITGEFQMMRSFLNVVDGDRLGNVIVRTWVRQIRDLAYDLEDCIEFVVHLDKNNRCWACWVRFLQSACWFMPCLAPLQLDEAVAELNRLKARVEDVSARNARYSIISESGSKQATAVEKQPVSGDAMYATAFDRTIVAAGTQKASLMDLLTKKGSGDLRVISVWGSGGGDLGMTSIVWDSYVDAATCESFACRAWVKLRHPFNPHEFVRSLTTQFFANTCQKQAGATIDLDVLKKMMANQGDFLTEFAQHVNEKRFLIVLEGLSTMEDWNAITMFFPKGENGSCIIVSTLHFEVARLSVGHPYRVLHLNQLPAQHAVYAFYKMENDPVPSYSLKQEAAKIWMERNSLVGRESEIKHLGDRTALATKYNQVMSVWGINGVGKSFVVKHVFCKYILNSKLYKKYAWVDLSHPFSLGDLSRSLLFSFESQDIGTIVTADHGAMRSKNPIVECRDEMLQNNTQKRLVVIDGLQSMKEWDLIQAELLSRSKPAWTFIVITSEESIATHCCGSSNGLLKYNVKGLEPESAFRLFLQVSEKQQLTADDEAVLRELVAKCGGLPKVIVEIGNNLMKRTIVGWKDRARLIKNNFIHELNNSREFGGLQGLFCWMESCTRNCPDYLKPCISYLSIFSPNQLIRRRRLLRRWIAEGYSSDSYEKTAEDNGEKQFLGLLSLGIVQQSPTLGLGGTRMTLCQLNNWFFREYIVSQLMEENLVFELDGSCTVSTQRRGRHLVISESWDRDQTVFESIDFARLRSLTVSGKWEPFFVSKGMKLLRVLDLEDAFGVKSSDLKKIVKCFRRLKFLSLRRCSKICGLPSSVGDLKQLQTLDARHTSIVTLPVNITKLQNLQYIRAGTTAAAHQQQAIPSRPHLLLPRLSDYYRGHHLVGVKMPPGIGKLRVLHTLGVVNVTASGTKAILEDLKTLTQLRKLGVSGINKSNSDKFLSAISALVHLESLSVWLDKDNQDCLEGIPLPLESLRSLKLHGLGDKLPAWSEKLTKLTKIDLEMDKILKQLGKTARFLGMLPELCILRVCAKKFEDGKLNVRVNINGREDDSYKKVKVLQIACSSDSDLEVCFGSKTMKCLEQLKVDCTSGSEYQFSCLGNLPELKEVCLKGPNAKAHEEYVGSLIQWHPNRPIVKLE